MEIRIRAGSVIGRDHLLASKNRQDTFRTGKLEGKSATLYAGVVSDGCGSEPYSEVGANLVSAYLVDELLRCPTVSLLARVNLAMLHLQHYLRGIALNHKNPEDFLLNHLLTTVVGYISDGEEILIFSKGDGQIYWGEEALLIDESNAPEYPAYRALDQNQLWTVGPRLMSFDLSEVQRVAVATDGFEPELIANYWGLEHPNGVQRKLNQHSRQKHFKDDATLITIEVET